METALITGASGGIGLELAREFAKHKIDVVLVARKAEKLKVLAEELSSAWGIKAIVMAKDLSKPESADELFKEVKQAGLEIGYLVNNAGLPDYGFFSKSDMNKDEDMINVNILSLTKLCRLVLPEMISRKQGKILNLASIAAFQPGPLMAVYYATKSYVLLFSEAIKNELKGTGVTVTALCPGPTQSGFQDAANMQESKLVKGKNLPKAAEVAAYGYRSMMKGKSVAIPGFLNWILVSSGRFAPRDIVTMISRKLADKK
jgi:short-subunit dehydrogenase